MGNDMSIKHIIARHELVDDVDHNIVKALQRYTCQVQNANKVGN
jgi:hypothetical protein